MRLWRSTRSLSRPTRGICALFADLKVALNFEALGFETAADPELRYRQRATSGGILTEAQKLWIQIIGIIDQAMKLEPSMWIGCSPKSDAQVHLGSIQYQLHSSPRLRGDGQTRHQRHERVSTQGSSLRSDSLDMTANDLLVVQPASLRDPQFALACAERAAALSHRKRPSMLLTLAQAYRATGQIEKSRATANEGLALLPTLQPGSVKPRIRKLLEMQAQTETSAANLPKPCSGPSFRRDT